MKYLLDTNAVVALLNGSNVNLARRLREHDPQDVGISAIVAHELFFGAFHSARVDSNLAVIDGLHFESIEYNKDDAREAGQIRAFLRSQGTPIGPYDNLIAGQARGRNLVLITHKVREFGRIPGLHIEDWQA
jgi:tRNA(fMet)-specific endonuclease VapC